jgi:hypothetical protein
MASVNQISVLADQDVFPEDFDMDQPRKFASHFNDDDGENCTVIHIE